MSIIWTWRNKTKHRCNWNYYFNLDNCDKIPNKKQNKNNIKNISISKFITLIQLQVILPIIAHINILIWKEYLEHE